MVLHRFWTASMALVLAVSGVRGQQPASKSSTPPLDLSGPCHIEYLPFKTVLFQNRIHCEHPAGSIREWEIIAGIPPELPQQRVHASRLFIYNTLVPGAVRRTVDETRQPIFWVRAPVGMLGRDDQIEATAEYELTSFKRHLAPGPPLRPVPALSDRERRLDLKETAEINYQAPAFQTFLKENSLLQKEGETTLAFGRRVHHFVRTYMRYNASAKFADTTILQDCQSRDGHCGNYSRLFVGIMRVNRIPARLLFGHWFTEDVSESQGQPHAQSEFFASGVGWVLADTSTSIPTGGWKPGWNIEEGFANDNSGFVTLNLHSPLQLPTHNFGPQTQAQLQSLYTPAVGGDWAKMQIKTSITIKTLPLRGR